uniref:Tryptophanase leader peptide n=1 Tax=Heterorhabditis bacteriophora TaxID=37862 RepID=A0A1I7WAB7_HETBA
MNPTLLLPEYKVRTWYQLVYKH